MGKPTKYKLIPDFPYHRITSEGDVETKLIRGSSKPRVWKKMRLSTTIGYSTIVIRENYKRGDFRVSRLVAKAFIPNPENKLEVNHINSNKLDNRIENLEWVTPKENMKHAFENNLVNHWGEHNGSAKLDNIKVLAIRTLMKGGWKNRDIAEHYGVTGITISNIRHNKRWKHVGV